MITIRQLEPPAVALRFQDARGHVFFDLPEGIELRTTQALDQVGEIGRITQEAALSVRLQATERNRAMLERYEPDALGRLSGKFGVEVKSDGERVELTACLVLRYSDAEGYEVELFGGDWQEDTEEIGGADLELPEVTWNRQSVIDAWGSGRQKPATVPGLASYGGWTQERGITLRDLRIWFNLGELLRAIFCAAGWTFRSPHLDEGDGQWWYGYLSGEFWHTYSTKQAEGYCEFTAASQEVPPYDRSNDPPRSIRYSSPNVDWTVDGAAADRATKQYEYEGDGTEVLTRHITIEADVDVTLPIPEGAEVPLFSVVIFSVPFRSFSPTELYREQYSGGEITERRLELTISEFSEFQVPPRTIRTTGEIKYIVNFEVWLVYEDGNGETAFQLNSAAVRFRPDPRYYVEGDTIRPGELLDPDLTGKDLIEAVAHLMNAKFVTDYGRKEVTMYSPYDYLRTEDLANVEGFFRRTAAPVDLRQETVPESLAWENNQTQSERFRRYDFKDGDDAYLEQTGGRSRFGRTVDLEEGTNGTKQVKNPLFEPTGMVVVEALQTSPEEIEENNARDIIIPALWDNTDGEISHNLGPRVCVWYGMVEQGEEDDPDFFYLEGEQVTEIPLLSMIPGSSIPGDVNAEPLAFAGFRTDLWNRFYRTEVLDEGRGPLVQVLITGGDDSYRKITLRDTVQVDAGTGSYELQPVAKRDHLVGSDVPLLLEGRNLKC